MWRRTAGRRYFFRCLAESSEAFRGSLRYGGTGIPVNGNGRTIHSEKTITTLPTGEPVHIHSINGYVANLYLCEYPERDEAFILDGGSFHDADRMRFYVETVLKKDFNKFVKLSVATHAHPDHSAGCRQYVEWGVPQAIAEGHNSHYPPITGLPEFIWENVMLHVVAHRLGRRKEYAVSSRTLPNPVAELQDGSTLPCGFDDWACIKVPGHTTHMVLLYHPASGILYSADMLVRHNGRFMSPVPIDIQYAFDHSIHRLRGLDPKYVMFAHWGVLEVEDAGGWQAMLDEVVEFNTKPRRFVPAMFKFMGPFMSHFSVVRPYHRGLLPSRHLPHTITNMRGDTTPVMHLK